MRKAVILILTMLMGCTTLVLADGNPTPCSKCPDHRPVCPVCPDAQ